MNKENISKKYDKYYKLLFLIPAIILVLSVIYLYAFSVQNGDLIRKDITLTGGTSIQVNSNTDIGELKTELENNFEDISVRQISNLVTGEQIAFVIETSAKPDEIKPFLENYLGFELDTENSSVEFTGSSLSESFYKELILAILFSFTFMGTVVFLIFGKNTKVKVLLVILALTTPFLFFFIRLISINTAFLFSIIILAISTFFYIRFSIPSFAVVLSAFSDMIMTLAFVNLIGMKISTAGIVAFLMLIGYSVDTDILLTARVLKRHGTSINAKIFSAFKTGITMTLTSLLVVIVGYYFTASFSKIFGQIFVILIIGLSFDIINTWCSNASLLKWYVEKQK